MESKVKLYLNVTAPSLIIDTISSNVFEYKKDTNSFIISKDMATKLDNKDLKYLLKILLKMSIKTELSPIQKIIE
jgi:hypothetical protein